MKTKSLISSLAMLALVLSAQRGVSAAGDSEEKKPPSLGKVENVDAASSTGMFTGLTVDKKAGGLLHAVPWAPIPASANR